MIISRSLRRALLAGICGAALLTSLCPAAPAANAQSVRDQIPIVAGTALRVYGYYRCTAGVVLQSRSWVSLATPIGRATRYVVLAKHCADYADPISVDGQVVGRVSWRSPTHDIELVTIPPSVVQRPVCSGASQLHHCTIPPATPRALGRIILNSIPPGIAVPIVGFGVPAVGERFCTSGSRTDINCAFEITDIPPGQSESGQDFARTMNGVTLQPGDSGGPVAGVNGRLYGIISKRGSDNNRDIMGYVPMFVVMQDLGYLYELAPA
ncbi:hypothetical protein [Rathayibacter agropyri]|uniref:hypothetical protein n=1 Tax=Rathayibacter agropyri TaxID=1634927 RepID=UPI0015638F0A|nr:hypothetical protein [Rathayibacter agropyri]NRD08941.1 hypothetical protein [Rathayibacter agropyri]